METTANPSKMDRFSDYCRHANGTGQYHRVGYGPLLATDGVIYACSLFGCYWLADVIQSVQSGPLRLGGSREFQVWRVMPGPGRTASEATGPVVVECWSDTPGDRGSRLLYRQPVEYSDLDPDALGGGLTFWVIVGALLLPCEY